MAEKYFKHTCKFCCNSWESYRPKPGGCESCGNSHEEDFLTREIQPIVPKDLIDEWLIIGKKNPWICRAYDPPFSRGSICECETIEDLKERFVHGNWCLGQAFYYKDLCFINQVNGGCEWLTIKGKTPFESLFMTRIIEAGEFESLIDRFERATEEQCRKLEY